MWFCASESINTHVELRVEAIVATQSILERRASCHCCSNTFFLLKKNKKIKSESNNPAGTVLL